MDNALKNSLSPLSYTLNTRWPGCKIIIKNGVGGMDQPLKAL